MAQGDYSNLVVLCTMCGQRAAIMQVKDQSKATFGKWFARCNERCNTFLGFLDEPNTKTKKWAYADPAPVLECQQALSFQAPVAAAATTALTMLALQTQQQPSPRMPVQPRGHSEAGGVAETVARVLYNLFASVAGQGTHPAPATQPSMQAVGTPGGRYGINGHGIRVMFGSAHDTLLGDVAFFETQGYQKPFVDLARKLKRDNVAASQFRSCGNLKFHVFPADREGAVLGLLDEAGFEVVRATDAHEAEVRAALEAAALSQKESNPTAVKVTVDHVDDDRLHQATSFATQGYKQEFIEMIRKLREEREAVIEFRDHNGAKYHVAPRAAEAVIIERLRQEGFQLDIVWERPPSASAPLQFVNKGYDDRDDSDPDSETDRDNVRYSQRDHRRYGRYSGGYGSGGAGHSAKRSKDGSGDGGGGRGSQQPSHERRRMYEEQKARDEADIAAQAAEDARKLSILEGERKALLREAAELLEYLPRGVLRDQADLEFVRTHLSTLAVRQ